MNFLELASVLLMLGLGVFGFLVRIVPSLPTHVSWDTNHPKLTGQQKRRKDKPRKFLQAYALFIIPACINGKATLPGAYVPEQQAFSQAMLKTLIDCCMCTGGSRPHVCSII